MRDRREWVPEVLTLLEASHLAGPFVCFFVGFETEGAFCAIAMSKGFDEIVLGALHFVGNFQRITRRFPSADGLSDFLFDVDDGYRLLHVATIHEGV